MNLCDTATFRAGTRKIHANLLHPSEVFEEKFFANDIHAAKKAADILKSFNQYTAGISEPIPLVHMNMPEVWTQVGGPRSLPIVRMVRHVTI